MSSGITFSGFNNIDFSYILNAIMQQESQPVVALQARQTALQSQQSAFSTLASKLTALDTAMAPLADRTQFGGRAAASSNSAAVAVSASSAASIGAYDIVVKELARAQTTATNSTHSDKDTTAVASGGSLVINGVAVTVTVPATLQDLADAINANDDVSVSAAVVSTAPGSYQLVLTGKGTGIDEAFTIANNLTGGSGVSFGINAQDALNAKFTVNNIEVQSATNNVDDVIPGVSLTLLKKDPTATVNVSVTADKQAAVDQVKSFVTSFNDILAFAKDQAAAASKGETNNIGRDALLRALRTELRGEMNHEYATGGTYSYLSQVGLGFDRSGKLTLDEKKFAEATKNGTAEVMKLFAGANGVGGAFTKLQSLVTGYTEAGGLVPDAKERITAQLQSVAKRITSMEARLAIRRAGLNKEFIATDQAMSALNKSVDALSSLGGQYRLF
jgi:flagellar hook-associated protein 2